MLNIDLKSFDRVVFFTGAGMSAESGVPTYRGRGGIWASYRFEDYACQEAFDRDPEGVLDFHEMRREKVGECVPHEGYRLLSDYESKNPSCVVITQNIDGFHRKSGNQNVFELHGSLWRSRCDKCGESEEVQASAPPIRQHHCGAFLRPDIVWFGDALNMDVVGGALAAIRNCDLLISIGTSAVVMPAAGFPLEAKGNGAYLLEINPESTDLSAIYDESLRMTASEGLRQLLIQGS